MRCLRGFDITIEVQRTNNSSDAISLSSPQFNNLLCVRYTSDNTNNAQRNFCTCGPFRICPNQLMTINGCSCSGQTYLALIDESNQVLQPNTPCVNASSCSFLTYRHQEAYCTTVHIREGCKDNSQCMGLVVARIEGLGTIADDTTDDNYSDINGSVVNKESNLNQSMIFNYGNHFHGRNLQSKFGLLEHCSNDYKTEFHIPTDEVIIIISIFLFSVSMIIIIRYLCWKHPYVRKVRQHCSYLSSYFMDLSTEEDENNDDNNSVNNSTSDFDGDSDHNGSIESSPSFNADHSIFSTAVAEYSLFAIANGEYNDGDDVSCIYNQENTVNETLRDTVATPLAVTTSSSSYIAMYGSSDDGSHLNIDNLTTASAMLILRPYMEGDLETSDDGEEERTIEEVCTDDNE